MRLAHQGSIRKTWQETGAYSVWFQSWYLEVQLQAYRGATLGLELRLWEHGRWRPWLNIQLGWVRLCAHKTFEGTRMDLAKLKRPDAR